MLRPITPVPMNAIECVDMPPSRNRLPPRREGKIAARLHRRFVTYYITNRGGAPCAATGAPSGAGFGAREGLSSDGLQVA